jgi:hypothetical protein
MPNPEEDRSHESIRKVSFKPVQSDQFQIGPCKPSGSSLARAVSAFESGVRLCRIEHFIEYKKKLR